jgi:hypothetical protein
MRPLGAALVGLLTLVVLPLALAEFTDWCPWFGKKLVHRAVGKLPSVFQERYCEEWLAEVDAVPGKLSKVVMATILLLRSRTMGRVLQESLPEPATSSEKSPDTAVIDAVMRASRAAPLEEEPVVPLGRWPLDDTWGSSREANQEQQGK